MPFGGGQLGKTIVQWVLGGVTVLAVIAAAVASSDLSPAERSAMWHGVGRAVVWAGIVLVLPWASFFLTTAVARRESNAAGVALVVGYTLLDLSVLLLLVGVPAGAFLICATVLGGLVGLTYNLLVCDWVAEHWS